MADLPKSQLPTEPEYWDDLARKVGDDAAGPLAAYAAQDGWYGVLAQRAPWLVAASAAAMLILWVALPTRDSSVALRWMERALGPSDLAGTLIGGAEPPSVNVLLVQFAPQPSDADQR